MFFTEIKPILQEVRTNPAAFFGGLFSGLLQLKLEEDPLKTWLNNQDFSSSELDFSATPKTGPQSIDIE